MRIFTSGLPDIVIDIAILKRNNQYCVYVKNCFEGNLKMKRTGEKKKISSSKLKTDRDHAVTITVRFGHIFV